MQQHYSVPWMERLIQMAIARFGARSSLLARGVHVVMVGIAALALGVSIADARPGGGKSFGSRGANTQNAAPPTNTAPRAADPIQKPSAGSSVAGQSASRPGTAAAAPARSGFGSMLMGGLLGAGLFGLLSGSGLFSGLGSLAGILGFVLQFALIGGVIYLAMMFFRSRNQPAVATATAARTGAQSEPVYARQGMMTGGGAGPALGKLEITGDDFGAFERLLGNIQNAYSRQDLSALRSMTTTEVLNQFSDEIADDTAQGVANRIANVKLLQGDLSEAWNEPGADYATVAMRFSIDDTQVELATGKIVATYPAKEVTEVWTFRRTPGASASAWKLSAIQQV